MKLVISAQEKNLDGCVDARFGRAKFFVVYDSDRDLYSWHENNQNIQAAQGAGIQAAQKAVDLSADAVITGNCGPKAFKVLSLAKITTYSLKKQMTIREAVHAVLNDELDSLQEANVEGHWL